MRVKLRFVLGVAVIWLAAVAGVSATAWLAIDRAGRDVTSATDSALRPASIEPVAVWRLGPNMGGASFSHRHSLYCRTSARLITAARLDSAQTQPTTNR